jgi:hypothetical protein
VGPHDSPLPFESPVIGKQEDHPQPLPVLVREPVAHDVSVPVLLNEDTFLEYRLAVDRSSLQQEAQIQYMQVTNGMFPLTLVGYVVTCTFSRRSFDY